MESGCSQEMEGDMPGYWRPLVVIALCVGLTERTESEIGLLSMQTYDDTELCTWVDSAMNWNMQTTRYSQQGRGVRAPFDGRDIVGVKTMVYADQSTPEVFNISRMPGRAKPSNYMGTSFYRGHRGGGYSSFTWWDSDTLHMEFDRGPCWGNCNVGTDSANNFYVGNFPFISGGNTRSFTNTSNKKRASMLMDYVCEDPESSPASVHTIWKRLGGWDMPEEPSKALDISPYGIASGNIVDLSTVIHSDPNEYDHIQVDNLEHATSRNWNYPSWRGRGGILWLGYGCRNSGVCAGPGGSTGHTNYRLRLHTGPIFDSAHLVPSAGTPSNYRRFDYRPNTSGDPQPLEYQSTSANRGWVKIRYIGTKSSTKIPFAMKTRVLASGSWDMTTATEDVKYYDHLPFSELRIAAGRISGLSTVILSDPYDTEPSQMTATDFHRPMDGDSENLGGGLTYVDAELDREGGSIWLSMIGSTSPANGNFYYNSASYNDQDYTRSHVKVDYVAGSCAQGPNDFEIRAIPSGPNRDGECDGTSDPFVIEGAGDMSWGSINEWGQEDRFTFVSHHETVTYKEMMVCIDGLDEGEYGIAGLMMRASMDKDASHISVLLGMDGVLRFLYRDGDGTSNVQVGSTSSISPPVWIKLEKGNYSGGQFYYLGGYNSSSCTSPPFSMTGFMKVLPNDLFDSNYHIGMVVSNQDAPLTKATFRGLTEN